MLFQHLRRVAPPPSLIEEGCAKRADKLIAQEVARERCVLK